VSNAQEKLVRCFQAVFPDLRQDEVARASTSSLSAWDSVATVRLAAAVEEEFDIQFEVDQIEKMTSFQSCLELLAGR
jgi:acyl carrier protein